MIHRLSVPHAFRDSLPTFEAVAAVVIGAALFFVATSATAQSTQGNSTKDADILPQRVREIPILQHLRPNPAAADAESPAAGTVSRMFLPEGFQAEVIASEPDLHQPIAFTFDERG